MSRSTPEPANLDRLIAADPIERLLASVEVEIRLRARRFRRAEASLELEMLRSFKDDLEGALRDARAAEITGNVRHAAKLANRPLSTVRRICSKYGVRAGATLVEGEYSIHLPTFLRFLAAMPRRPDGTAGDDHHHRPVAAAAEPTHDNHDSDNPLEEAA